MTNSDVIVVGGGIGGLAAAFALTREGLSVRVLEQASEYGEVGAGLQIAPNCTRILAEHGLLDEARSLGVLPKAMIGRDAVDGTELTRLDLLDLEKKYGFPYMVIHRSDLHAIFLPACRRAGVDLQNNCRVDDYESTSEGAVVKLADGRVESASLVIAADGLHSVARDKFVGDKPVNSGADVHHGTAEITREKRAGVLDTAYAAHPERFARRPPQPPTLPTIAAIKPTRTEGETHSVIPARRCLRQVDRFRSACSFTPAVARPPPSTQQTW